MTLNPDDLIDEINYPLTQLTREVLDIITIRQDHEKLSFKEMSIEQLATRLNGDISKLPSLLHQDFYQQKANILNTIASAYCILANATFKEKQKIEDSQ